jgi:hypothetical protein
VSVAIADKASTLGRLEDCGFENPEVLLGTAQWKHGFGMNTVAVTALR